MSSFGCKRPAQNDAAGHKKKNRTMVVVKSLKPTLGQVSTLTHVLSVVLDFLSRAFCFIWFFRKNLFDLSAHDIGVTAESLSRPLCALRRSMRLLGIEPSSIRIEAGPVAKAQFLVQVLSCKACSCSV